MRSNLSNQVLLQECGHCHRSFTDERIQAHCVKCASAFRQLSKHHRAIHSAIPDGSDAIVDVYSILDAYDVTCSATHDAVTGLLLAGSRGATRLDDLQAASLAVQRAIEMEKARAFRESDAN